LTSTSTSSSWPCMSKTLNGRSGSSTAMLKYNASCPCTWGSTQCPSAALCPLWTMPSAVSSRTWRRRYAPHSGAGTVGELHVSSRLFASGSVGVGAADGVVHVGGRKSAVEPFTAKAMAPRKPLQVVVLSIHASSSASNIGYGVLCAGDYGTRCISQQAYAMRRT
jgi:hypothetical protein